MCARAVLTVSMVLTVACGETSDPVADSGVVATTCSATQWPTYACTGTTFEEMAR